VHMRSMFQPHACVAQLSVLASADGGERVRQQGQRVREQESADVILTFPSGPCMEFLQSPMLWETCA